MFHSIRESQSHYNSFKNEWIQVSTEANYNLPELIDKFADRWTPLPEKNECILNL